ncbi:MAG: HipA domain-containing protein [Oscillospiraceae bacterium]|nr:HipA domain-containing protein [Oscillospiraceae bacterium]
MEALPSVDSTNKKVSKYTIMYENTAVLTFDRNADKVDLHDGSCLPFGLRGNVSPKPAAVLEWLIFRIDNLQRTYMNMVYLARQVGRDRDKVLSDSAGVSCTDNFWIKTSDVLATWDELTTLRDENRALSTIALTGNMNGSTPQELLKGFTSLFTTKGHFTKAILGGSIYKLKEDALLELPAYLIGKHIGVSIAECELENGFIKIKLFTSPAISLVHAAELKTYFDTTDEIYNHMLQLGRTDIVNQLQRMYIFNYIIGNPDLHDENTGLLYDAKTFEFLAVSPCYDHNIAFQEGFGGLSRATKGNSSSLPLDDWTKLFINNHPDIVEKLKLLPYTKINKYLSKRQIAELKDRVKKVLGWFEEKS